MTWTYAAPPATPKDEVRFWSGDNVAGLAQSESDEDIEYLLSKLNYEIYPTAALVARRIGDKFAALGIAAMKRVGPFQLSKDNAAQATTWYARADRLASGTPNGSTEITGALFTGGSRPVFRIGMQDNGRRQSGEDSAFGTRGGSFGV